jgi:hypothetical protein
MTDTPLPDFIIVGPQKCATTWIYKCLYEHPEVYLPETDSVHYFDINYHRDIEYYQNSFSSYEGESIVGEETATYIREQEAPRRIYDTIPDVKLIFTFRNPIDRAYSHWWHDKSKNKHSYEFDRVLKNYDLYQNWIVPGFYYRHLSRYLDYFPKENIKVCVMDDLVEDEWRYLKQIYTFLGIKQRFTPLYINKKANQGSYRFDKKSLFWKATNLFKNTAPEKAVNAIKPIHSRIVDIMANKSEYEEGMSENMRRDLEEIYIEDIENLSNYLDRDLSGWLEFETLG